jgi:hypothetical protein
MTDDDLIALLVAALRTARQDLVAYGEAAAGVGRPDLTEIDAALAAAEARR